MTVALEQLIAGEWTLAAIFETERAAYVAMRQALRIAPGLYRIRWLG